MSNHLFHPALYLDCSELLLVVEMQMSKGFIGVEENGVRARGHSRSASHGGIGGSVSPSSSMGTVGRPSALKGHGHQRAFSQGTIETDSLQSRGHNRVSSKTDFILPPGHRESTFSGFSQRKGHSREASRSESIYTLRNTAPPSKWRQMLCAFLQFQTVGTEEESRFRTVVPNHMVPPHMPKKLHPNGSRCDNRISTTKYTLLSFLPKNLFEQFHRVANLYFIFIVLLNWVPSINAFGKEIAMIPVMFVLGVTGIKDLFEDRRRHASDKRINNSFCRVYVSEEERYKKMLWKEIRVGDIVHLSNNEFIPADILMLRSSDSQGLCYIDTCNLDGETNLKARYVPRGFVNKQDEFSPSLFRSVIEVDAPTTKIYRFLGAIIHPSGERVPVGTENLLLRDCVLKNTDFVEGIVVYAGHETKAMLNNNGPRYKRSSLEKKINEDIMWCVVLLLIFCSLGAAGSYYYLSSYPEDVNIFFLPVNYKPEFEGFLTFWTFIIILQVMIPLSLYVTVEMAKLLQVYHINNNIYLFDAETGKKVECRALNITEELGQIQYIFSDKTGTLTENKMLFRRCTVNGVDYNHQAPESAVKPADPAACEITINSRLQAELINSSNNYYNNNYNNNNNIAVRIAENSSSNNSSVMNINSGRVREFLLVLAICNTVVVAKHPHHDSMDSSGIIEQFATLKQQEQTPESENVQVDFTPNSGPAPSNYSRYRRLTESRSITPSPTPLSMRDAVENVSSTVITQTQLSPIASSPDSTIEQKLSPIRPKRLAVQVPNLLSVVSRRNKNGVTKQTPDRPKAKKPIFEAESPDELALVRAAYDYNVRLTARTPTLATVKILDEEPVDYEVLNILPFDSTRKCMSIILRHPSNKEIIMYTKGADSTILSKLAPVDDLPSQQLLFKTQQHLNSYARVGLRVLVMASRRLTEEQYAEWKEKVDEAELSHASRDKKLIDMYIELERELVIVGATGIEDRLQDGVPETLSSLRAAGITIWVLTGDKPETAINIAYSARLFLPNMELLKLFARSKQAAESAIMFFLNKINERRNGSSDDIILPNTSNANRVPRKKALVIDGKTLTFILDRRSNLQQPFLDLTSHCVSVLMCRATPLQKAIIVRTVKEYKNVRTLAIGDGANDVSMIQTADVGIGISGQEGMQACMASDFTIPRFKYLEQLLLVHGHWAYDRLARMVLYFFYKNLTFVFLIFFYQFYCAFSGTVMIDPMCHMLYNLFFTSLPPIMIGVYDQDVPRHILLTRPGLYRKGRFGLTYRHRSFWVTTVDSLYQSLVILFICHGCYNNSDIGLWEFGTTIVTSCMFAMLGQAAFETKSWTILQCGAMIVSLGAYLLYSYVYNIICMQCYGLPSNVWVLDTTFYTSQFWGIVLLSTVVALLPRIVIQVISTTYWPNDSTRALIEEQQTRSTGDNFLVSWSRSTSTSSIYRTNEIPSRDVSTSTPHSNTLTAVG